MPKYFSVPHHPTTNHYNKDTASVWINCRELKGGDSIDVQWPNQTTTVHKVTIEEDYWNCNIHEINHWPLINLNINGTVAKKIRLTSIENIKIRFVE